MGRKAAVLKQWKNVWVWHNDKSQDGLWKRQNLVLTTPWFYVAWVLFKGEKLAQDSGTGSDRVVLGKWDEKVNFDVLPSFSWVMKSKVHRVRVRLRVYFLCQVGTSSQSSCKIKPKTMVQSMSRFVEMKDIFMVEHRNVPPWNWNREGFLVCWQWGWDGPGIPPRHTESGNRFVDEPKVYMPPICL